MEPYGRRSRNRRRCHSQCFALSSHQEERPRGGSILGCIPSLIIMASLIALIYMMLEYHCQNCKANYDLKQISKSIDDVVKNVNIMQERYKVLESKVQVCSQEFSRIERQTQTLEALAKSIENREFGWSNNYNPPLPRYKLYLSRSRPIRNNYHQMKNSTSFTNGSKTIRV